MKKIRSFVFFTFFLEVILMDNLCSSTLLIKCPIPDDYKLKLMSQSPYPVKDIECTENNSYRWVIKGANADNKKMPTKRHKRKPANDKIELSSNHHDTKKDLEYVKITNKQPLGDDSFQLGFSYGVEYLTYSQSGILGELDISTLLTKSTFFTSYKNNDFEVSSKFATYDFSFLENNTTQSKKFSSYELETSYYNFFVAAIVSQSPIFKNSSSSVDMTIEEMTFAKLGYRWNLNLHSKIKTNLLIDVAYTHLLSGVTSDTEVSANNYKGMFAMATGTGKTITSLNCLLNEYKKTGIYRAIITVPTTALVEQWKKLLTGVVNLIQIHF